MTSFEFTKWMEAQAESLCVSLLIIQNDHRRNASHQAPSSFLEVAFLQALIIRFVAEFGREPDEMIFRAFRTHLQAMFGTTEQPSTFTPAAVAP